MCGYDDRELHEMKKAARARDARGRARRRKSGQLPLPGYSEADNPSNGWESPPCTCGMCEPCIAYHKAEVARARETVR